MLTYQGIPALAALNAATKTNAELLGRSDDLGTVEPGQASRSAIADLPSVCTT